MFTTENQACTACGKTNMPLTTYVNAQTLKPDYICMICQSERANTEKRSAASYSDELEQAMKLSKTLEELIMSMPKQSKEMDEMGLGNMAFTPLSAFRGLQQMIAHLEVKRMDALIEEGGEAYLNAELEKAVASENFEKATEIRKQLEAIKNQSYPQS